ncbi:MAG: decaprenyl-phosphate phosphoribosyltransferase [Thermodesulfobacteriota bacterium]
MNSLLKDSILLIRPTHWVKNFLVVAPPFFAGIVFDSLNNLIIALLSFFSFSFASSAGYILNDLVDAESDRYHPVKKDRPLASGRIKKNTAIITGLLLLALAIIIGLKINLLFTLILVCYLALSTSYTLVLKNIVIIESFCIAGGFLLRIIAGGVGSTVAISGWLILTTFFLSLLLAFGKRKSELKLTDESSNFRKVLNYYDSRFLENGMVIFSTASIITYSIYLINKGVEIIAVTIPFVCFGILRYHYIVHFKSKGDPTDVLLKDFWLLFCVIVWLVVTGIFIYSFNTVSFLQ